jgi:hypothetical protein
MLGSLGNVMARYGFNVSQDCSRFVLVVKGESEQAEDC